MAEPLETLPVETASKPRPSLWLKQGRILVVDGPDRGRTLTFNPPRARIGTMDDNDLVLSDRTVSKHHVQIEEHPDGYLVRDLGSRNGSFMNGARIREAFFAPGSTVQLGNTVLRFEPPAEKASLSVSARSAFGEIQGAGPKIREVFGLLEKVAPSDLSVLILGETGTGKEVVARSIHQESRRRARPFVVFDCSAVSRELIDSALFGHQQGAFTGATAQRKGAFLSAEGGTLFIDEIGELPLDLQPKLLGALERQEVQPLGSDRPAKVDVRVIAATHRDLGRMVDEGTFRRDLMYRLSVVSVRLPPLRERPEDIPVLVKHFLALAGAAGHAVTASALALLVRAPWPGNVRELRNAIDRALVLAGAAAIDEEHLDVSTRAPVTNAPGDRKLEEVEAEAIRSTLIKTSWNKSKAARILGIARGTLQEKLDRYGIKP